MQFSPLVSSWEEIWGLISQVNIDKVNLQGKRNIHGRQRCNSKLPLEEELVT
jgi:hypothetical protein